jgi:hypothetical protein
MENCLQNFISNVAKECRANLEEYGDLAQLNVLWAGSPDYDARITQAEIDSVPMFHDMQLTTAQLADAAYALEQIRGIITAALPAFSILAQI